MPTHKVVLAMHDFLDAELMLELRRTEVDSSGQQYEVCERAKTRLIEAMNSAAGDPEQGSLIADAKAYLEAIAAFELSRRYPIDGTETAGPARRLERTQHRLQESLNRYARADKSCAIDRPRIKRILVPIDGSFASEWALQTAGQLAVDLRAVVKMIYVQPFYVDDDLRLSPVASEADASPLAGEILLEEFQLQLPREIESSIEQPSGDPAVEIVSAARRWGADYIVMGTSGRGRLSRFVLGSVSESVVRLAGCPVMTVGHAPGSSAPSDADLFVATEPLALAAP